MNISEKHEKRGTYMTVEQNERVCLLFFCKRYRIKRYFFYILNLFGNFHF